MKHQYPRSLSYFYKYAKSLFSSFPFRLSGHELQSTGPQKRFFLLLKRLLPILQVLALAIQIVRGFWK
jgi:hypothetical protein